MKRFDALDAFISYSRSDLDFVLALHRAITARNKDVWFDQVKEPLKGLPPASKWWEEIKYGIQNADNFIVVVSPYSTSSPYCNAELAHALAYEKRLVVVLYCGGTNEIETRKAIDVALSSISRHEQLPPQVQPERPFLQTLARRNWLEIEKIQYVVFSNEISFDSSIELLLKGIDRDLTWIRTWSSVRQTAQLWADDNFDDSYLWSERRLIPVRRMIEERGQSLTEIERRFLQSEQERLLAELQDADVTHLRRASIGDRLAFLGDQRPGVGLRPDGLPDISWIKVPGGETPVYDQTFPVGSFYIARYPISHRQFQAFLEHPDGATNPTWWTDCPMDDEQANYVTRTDQPSNYPQDKVSWWQAVAFSRWLTSIMPEDGWPDGSYRRADPTLPTSQSPLGREHGAGQLAAAWQFRLPTEWEWQWAAQGADGRSYPWGDQWDDRFANVKETGLFRTIAVGMYPQGATPTGIHDMSGNLWEWSMNANPPRFVLPRDVTTRTIEKDRTTTRTLGIAVRGGAFDRNYVAAACEDRDVVPPGLQVRYIGFRLVCANTETSGLI